MVRLSPLSPVGARGVGGLPCERLPSTLSRCGRGVGGHRANLRLDGRRASGAASQGLPVERGGVGAAFELGRCEMPLF